MKYSFTLLLMLLFSCNFDISDDVENEFHNYANEQPPLTNKENQFIDSLYEKGTVLIISYNYIDRIEKNSIIPPKFKTAD